ncbi:hypothetical protein CPS_1897 [Colwellia psychrerythraea 34H]|uniref:Uncharacterized protein n=1 Tax=Colwellia psychrerythraea (strain 34H / ATCC BAA-681) TaxID=167879 RepID=Q483Y9_COLP3|nr:hypothetical protein CPS_1897 [Colwellia psychrerythraea 34H]
MDDESNNKMSYKQSAFLWWSVFWRSILIGVFPLIFINLLLVKGFGITDSYATLLINLLWIPVTIGIQCRVINSKKFNTFSISVSNKIDS